MRFTAILLLCGLCTFLCGCDKRPRRVPVSGQVLIDGQPLSMGFVQFVPEKARAAVGSIDASGRFSLSTFGEGDGCVLGKHRIAVVAVQTLGPTRLRWLTPEKYRDATTSEMEVEITGPQSDLKIELSWSGGSPFMEEYHSQGDSDPSKLE